MQNQTSLQAVLASRFGEHFRAPLLDTYSFAQIPNTIRHLLTGAGVPGLPADVLAGLPVRYDRVLLIFVDGMGWAHIERRLQHASLLRRVASEGVISVLTSQFPSTTTVHMTTIGYGQPVGQHGLYEWFLYEPRLDRLIVPLQYCFAEDDAPNTLPFEPAEAAPGPTFIEQLAGVGVRSVMARKRELFGSRPAQHAFAGAVPVPFGTLEEGLDGLTQAVQAASGPTYGFLYYDGVDAASHQFGPGAPETAAQVDFVLGAIEQHLIAPLAAANNGRTLVLVTADHGQMEVIPGNTVYVNEVIPELEGLVRRGAGGRKLVPAGSSRDLFLHVQPGAVEQVVALLRAHPAVESCAEVYTTRELAEHGLFGETTEAFWRRAGDVVVLPYAGQMIWWREPGFEKHTQLFRGHHGGLSPAEMDIPLLAIAL